METVFLILAGLGAVAAIAWQIVPRRTDPSCPGCCQQCQRTCRPPSETAPDEPTDAGNENNGGP